MGDQAMKLLAGLTLLTTSLVFGQTGPPPAFEVASVKPGTAEPGSTSGITTSLGLVTARNVTLKRCIRGAYDVPENQVLGGPKWAEEDRYDIDARSAGRAGDHDLMSMLRALLTERFKLVFHRETRPLNGYALVVSKTGLKAKPSAPDAPSRSDSSRGSLDAEGCSMGVLAQKLAEVLHLPVADETKIEGRFDFQLTWTPEELDARTPASAADPGATIFAVLQERLGPQAGSPQGPDRGDRDRQRAEAGR